MTPTIAQLLETIKSLQKKATTDDLRQQYVNLVVFDIGGICGTTCSMASKTYTEDDVQKIMVQLLNSQSGRNDSESIVDKIIHLYNDKYPLIFGPIKWVARSETKLKRQKQQDDKEKMKARIEKFVGAKSKNEQKY